MTSSEQPDREIDFAELVGRVRATGAYVVRERRTVLRATIISAAIGVAIALTAQVEYSATTRLLPYRNGVSAGSLSGLAGLAGIQLPAGAGEQTITGDLYPVIAKTLDFRTTVAETPLQFAESPQPITLIRYFETHQTTYEKVSSALAEWRRRAMAAMTPGMPRDTTTRSGGDGLPLRTYGREYLKIIGRLDDRLVVSIDKKTAVITMTGMMPDPYAAADLVQTASQRLMQRIIDYEARKAAEQLAFVEEQHKLSKQRYEAAQRSLAEYQDRNRSLVGAVAQVQRERLQGEYDIAFQVFQKFSLELEQARIKKNQDTPVFTVLERVAVPNIRTKPQRASIVVIALILGLVWGVSEVLVRRTLANKPSDARG